MQRAGEEFQENDAVPSDGIRGIDAAMEKESPVLFSPRAKRIRELVKELDASYKGIETTSSKAMSQAIKVEEEMREIEKHIDNVVTTHSPSANSIHHPRPQSPAQASRVPNSSHSSPLHFGDENMHPTCQNNNDICNSNSSNSNSNSNKNNGQADGGNDGKSRHLRSAKKVLSFECRRATEKCGEGDEADEGGERGYEEGDSQGHQEDECCRQGDEEALEFHDAIPPTPAKAPHTPSTKKISWSNYASHHQTPAQAGCAVSPYVVGLALTAPASDEDIYDVEESLLGAGVSMDADVSKGVVSEVDDDEMQARDVLQCTGDAGEGMEVTSGVEEVMSGTPNVSWWLDLGQGGAKYDGTVSCMSNACRNDEEGEALICPGDDGLEVDLSADDGECVGESGANYPREGPGEDAGVDAGVEGWGLDGPTTVKVAHEAGEADSIVDGSSTRTSNDDASTPGDLSDVDMPPPHHSVRDFETCSRLVRDASPRIENDVSQSLDLAELTETQPRSQAASSLRYRSAAVVLSTCDSHFEAHLPLPPPTRDYAAQGPTVSPSREGRKAEELVKGGQSECDGRLPRASPCSPAFAFIKASLILVYALLSVCAASAALWRIGVIDAIQSEISFRYASFHHAAMERGIREAYQRHAGGHTPGPSLAAELEECSRLQKAESERECKRKAYASRGYDPHQGLFWGLVDRARVASDYLLGKRHREDF